MRKKNIIPLGNWYRFFLYGVLFIAFFGHIARSHDPDFGWHLMVGQEIVSTQAVPGPENRLYPIQGVSWIDHEWLTNAILFIIYTSSQYGDFILYGVFALCATLCLALTEYITYRWLSESTDERPESRLIFVSLLLTLATFILLPYTGIRLQIFSWLFFLLTISIILLFLEKRQVIILWLLPALLLFWTNFHGSFVLGLIGSLSSLCIIALFLSTTQREKIHLFLVGIASILSTLLTPYGLELWRLVFLEYTQNDFYRTHLAEWLPIYIIPPFETASFIIFPLALVTLLLASHKQLLALWLFKRYPRLLIPFVTGIVLLAIFYIENRRHAPFFLFVILFLLIPLITRSFNLRKIFRPLFYGILLPLLIWISVRSFMQFPYIPEDPFSVIYTQDTPKGVVDFLKTHEAELSNMRIFNYYSWGGYLEWTLPKWHFFIDGRFPQMPLPGKQHSYLEEYYRLTKNKESFNALIEEYDISLIVLNKNWEMNKNDIPIIWRYFLPKTVVETLNQSNSWLYDYLERGWEILYSDDMSIILKKDSNFIR